jgi:hypothetical protein
VNEALDQRLQVVQQAAARPGNIRGQLVEILAALFEYFHKNRDLTRLAFSAAFAAPGEVPHDVRYLDRCQRNLEFMHSLMKRARAAGHWTSALIAATWLMVFTGRHIFTLWRTF